MDFRLLGPIEVWADGRQVPVGPPKRRCLLAVLLLELGHVVTVDRLIDVLWAEQPPPGARRVVLVHVSRLRAALAAADAGRGSVALVTSGAGYALHAAPDTVDVHRFRDLCRQARDSDDDTLRVELLGRALAEWRGAALSGVAPEPLRLRIGRGLDEARTAAREDRIDALLRLGQHGAVLDEIVDLTHRYPLRDRPHGQLMLALHQEGGTADALRAYQEYRRRLAEETGLDPGPQLRELETAILRQDRAVREAATTPVRPAFAPVPAQLPAAVPAFIGRRDELARLDALLAGRGGAPGSAAAVIAAVSGAPGVGKTALAVHWAHRVAERFPDGQLYLNLHGFDPSGRITAPAEALVGLLDTLGVPGDRIPSGLDARAALYRSLLAGKRVLVVLDNARDAEHVRPLLPGTPTAMAVVTSRDQLRPLVADGAYATVLGALSEAESRALLAGRLGADRVAEEPRAIGQIIGACARLPLALSVAAARAATHPAFPLTALAGELAGVVDRLDALAGGDPNGDIRAVFSWSYRDLSGPTSRLFRLLGLHPGPDISVAAAASLTGTAPAEVRPLLAELARANLINESAPARYAFHDLLRVYATDLARAVDDDTTRRGATERLLDHYTHTAHAAGQLLDPNRDPMDLPLRGAAAGTTVVEFTDRQPAAAWFAAERAALLSALRLAEETGRDVHIWQLAWGMGTYLYRRGYWREMADAWRAGLRAARRLADPIAQARAHRGLAFAQTRSDDGWDEAERGLARALHLYTRAGDTVGRANVYRMLALLEDRQGRLRPALANSRRSLALYEAAGHRNGQADALNQIGWFLTQLGNHEDALVECTRALPLHRGVGDRAGEGYVWDTLGYAHHQLGHYAEATGCYERSLALFRDLGDRYEEALVLHHLGDTHRAAGSGGAVDAWRRALEIFTQLDHPDAGTVRAKLAHADRTDGAWVDDRKVTAG